MRRLLPWLVLGGLLLLSRSGVRKVSKTQQSARVPNDERLIVVNALAEDGWPAAEVMAAINIESGWRADALNPTTYAAGLIQLMPDNLARLGFNSQLPKRERALQFRSLSALQQLPWIRAFFSRMPRWSRPGDTYVALAASGYVGVPDDRIVYAAGTPAWSQNPAWRPADGGDITAGSIRALLLRRMQKAQA